ncbi:hypothetical protein BDAP_000418 [Binucleata daphniae]
MIDAAIKQTDINKLSTSNVSFVELKDKLKENIEHYNQCEKHYTKIVNKFIKEYIKDYEHLFPAGHNQISCTIKLPLASISDSYNTYRQNSIKEFFKNYNIGYNEQKFFNYYAGLFIDSIKFYTKTYNEIINLMENNSKTQGTHETLQKIGEDGKLMKKFMLSCDWIQKIIHSTNLCCLYNYYMFNIEHVDDKHFYIEMRFVTQEGSIVIGTEFIRYVQDYIHAQKEIETLQKIIKMENIEEIYNFIASKHEIEDSEKLKEKVEEILMVIALEKSHNTKNTYVAKKKYYNLNDDDCIKYEAQKDHHEIIKELAIEDKIPNFYKLNISTYCMYSLESILATKDIIEQIKINIGEIIENTDVLTEHLFKAIKDKICKFVQEQKNKTDDKIADKICDKIKEIANPSIRFDENKFEEKTLEKMTNKFYSKLMEIYSECNLNNTKIKRYVYFIKKGVELNIYEKYTKLMTKVKELHNISKETTTMLNEFNKYMEMIETYTKQIRTEFIDTEDIYLGLNQQNKDGKAATDNLQNERKLCEMRIVKIMESVINYKSIIVQTEESMLEIVNEIENLQNQIFEWDGYMPIIFYQLIDIFRRFFYNK